MEWFVAFFRDHPVIPIFLVLGLGFWLGKVKIGSFSLGAVAATLLVGVVIGQMNIVIPDILKTVFFLFFLFTTGYNVGPQFFRSFRGAGVRQMLFAIVEALVCASLVIAASYIMGYDNGIATGLYAGSQTASACLGMVSDTVREMPLDEERRQYLLMIIPGCYAVTYVLGTIGTAWFLSSIGPKMMGGREKVLSEVARIEQEMDTDGSEPQAGQIRAGRPVVFRAYSCEGDFFSHPHTVDEIENMLASDGARLFVERLRTEGRTVDPSGDTVVKRGDHIVIAGRKEDILELQNCLGREIADPELLNFGAEKTPVTVSAKGVSGLTIGDLKKKNYMQRVIIASVKRGGLQIPLLGATELHSGDVVTLVGWPRDVASAADAIGYADRQTNVTDMVFLGLGIAFGCFIGALSVKIKGIPMSLGVSVGALLSGLFLGWVRNRHPSFGRIPSSVIWLFNNLGVNMFIAVIGITAGASFLHGIHKAGVMIFAIGAVCTIAGLVINIFLARKLFRFSAPETLGCVAGGRCSVAAIGAIRDALQSDVPNLSFTITYAVANVSLVFGSLLVLFLV